MQLASLTITRWWWAPARCREQDQELLAVVQERFHSAANNRPPACSAAFGPVRHLGYGQLVDSPGIADRNRRTANRETRAARSEEHTSELQSLMRISYAVFCLKKKTQKINKEDRQSIQTKKHPIV